MAGGMASAVQGLYITLNFNVVGAASLQKANQQLVQTKSAARNAGASMKSLGGIFNRSHVAFASMAFMLARIARNLRSMFAVSVGDVLNFQDSLANTSRTTGLLGEDLNRLGKYALQISNNLGTAATDITSAMRELGRTGIFIDAATGEATAGAAEGIAELTEQYMMMVKTGDISLQRAMEIIPRTANLFKVQFGGDMVEANRRILDIVSAVSHSIAGTAEDLTYFIGRMTVAADKMNWTAEQTAAMSGMFIDLNTRAQRAGSAFAKMFNVMLSDKPNEYIRRMTGYMISQEQVVAAFLQITPAVMKERLKSPTEAVELLLNLRDRVAAMAKESPLLAEEIMTALGFSGLRLEDITGKMLSRDWFRERFQQLVEIGEGSEGDVLARFNKLMDSVTKQFERMRETTRNAMIEAFLPMVDTIKPTVKEFADWLDIVVLLNPELLKISIGIIGVTAAFFTVGSVLAGVLFLVSMLGHSLVLAGLLMSGFATTAAVTAMITYAAWRLYAEKITKLWDNLSSATMEFWMTLQDDSVWGELEWWIEQTGEKLLHLFLEIGLWAYKSWSYIKRLILEPLHNALSALWDMAKWVGNFFYDVLTNFGLLEGFIAGIVVGLHIMAAIFQVIYTVWDNTVGNFLRFFAEILGGVWIFKIWGFWMGILVTYFIAVKMVLLSIAMLKTIFWPFIASIKAIVFLVGLWNLGLKGIYAKLVAVKGLTLLMRGLRAIYIGVVAVAAAFLHTITLTVGAMQLIKASGVAIGSVTTVFNVLTTAVTAANVAAGILNGQFLLWIGLPIIVGAAFFWLGLKLAEWLGATGSWLENLGRIANGVKNIMRGVAEEIENLIIKTMNWYEQTFPEEFARTQEWMRYGAEGPFGRYDYIMPEKPDEDLLITPVRPPKLGEKEQVEKTVFKPAEIPPQIINITLELDGEVLMKKLVQLNDRVLRGKGVIPLLSGRGVG